MKRPPPSLRSQLLLWLLIPNACLWVVAIVATYYFTTRLTNSAYDDGLADTLHTLARRVRFVAGRPLLALPAAAIALLQEDDVDKAYYQILGPNLEFVSGEPAIPRPANFGDSVEYFDTKIGAREVRVAAQRVFVPASRKDPHRLPVYLQVAETFTGRELVVTKTLRKLVLPFCLLVALTIVMVFLAMNRLLVPLNRVRWAVSRRSFSDLTLLDPLALPAEIVPLVSEINNLLSRLREDRDVQQRFLANAAHSLRTPLAGVKAQAELALRQGASPESWHVLTQINRGMDQMSRLVKQLLTIVRFEPGAFNQGGFEKCDLVKLAKEVSADLVATALKKNIELSFEAPDEPAMVNGDAHGLREIVGNLLDNALNYTQSGGHVMVKVEKSGGVRLIIEDDGLGVPLAERQKVFERFYRIPGRPHEGTGLGLAIVQEITRTHKGTVEFLDSSFGPGTKVQVSFAEA
jgi:two-component system, OmpR family, sensor histidine kinase TctE